MNSCSSSKFFQHGVLMAASDTSFVGKLAGVLHTEAADAKHELR